MNVIHTTIDKIKIPQRYIPKSLKQKDKLKQKKKFEKITQII